MIDKQQQIDFINELICDVLGDKWDESFAIIGEHLFNNGVYDSYYARKERAQEIADSIIFNHDNYTNDNKNLWENEEWCKGWKCAMDNVKLTLKVAGANIKK